MLGFGLKTDSQRHKNHRVLAVKTTISLKRRAGLCRGVEERSKEIRVQRERKVESLSPGGGGIYGLLSRLNKYGLFSIRAFLSCSLLNSAL